MNFEYWEGLKVFPHFQKTVLFCLDKVVVPYLFVLKWTKIS